MSMDEWLEQMDSRRRIRKLHSDIWDPIHEEIKARENENLKKEMMRSKIEKNKAQAKAAAREDGEQKSSSLGGIMMGTFLGSVIAGNIMDD